MLPRHALAYLDFGLANDPLKPRLEGVHVCKRHLEAPLDHRLKIDMIIKALAAVDVVVGLELPGKIESSNEERW